MIYDSLKTELSHSLRTHTLKPPRIFRVSMCFCLRMKSSISLDCSGTRMRSLANAYDPAPDI